MNARPLLLAGILGTVLTGLLVGCLGRGGGGGGGSAAERRELLVDGLFYGRGLRTVDASGQQSLQVVSPLTLVDQDPLSGDDLPDTLQPLIPHAGTGALVPVPLSAEYVPVVIPRNGVLVVRFTRELDPASVMLDETGEEGEVLAGGSIRIRDARGRAVALTWRVDGESLLLDPVGTDRVGWPASPLTVDASGRPLTLPEGYLRLTFPSTGDHVLRARDGSLLGDRRDALGSADRPIGLHPGNAALDFIQENHLAETTETFNGFLPDRREPRIMRVHAQEDVVTRDDAVGVNSLRIATASFDTRARDGFGEWAGERLVIRGGTPAEEAHRVLFNTAQRLVLESAFEDPPRVGDTWRLARSELYEPDPENPLDPDRYDPFNPQNAANHDLANFIVFDEIDETGTVRDVDGDGITHYPPGTPVPSRSILRIRFDEPVDPESCLPYESLRIEDDPLAGESAARLGFVTASDGGRLISFVPGYPTGGTGVVYAGLGTATQPARRFAIVTVPPLEFLQEKVAPDAIDAFLARGIRPVTDLAGRPLAFALSEFDPQVIGIERRVSFEIYTDPAQSYVDVGAVVHRFQGRPEIRDDPVSGEPGVAYHDHEGLYSRVPDINVSLAHRLGCAPLVYDQRRVDDRPGNRPPGDDFVRFPAGVQTPLNGVYGARFQHIYRVSEASLSRHGDLAGTLMDLFRISFAPIGGHVSGPDLYSDISVHAAHSEVVPVTTQTGGIPDDPQSGLGEALDPESFTTDLCGSTDQQRANYIDPLEQLVAPGTHWTIDEGSIYGFAGSPYRYHSWPEFDHRFAYDNEHSLLLEYRIRPQATPVSGENGFTFSPAMRASFYPRFRVFSLGDRGNQLHPDPTTPVDRRAYCASGPVNPGVFGDNSRYFYAFDYVKTTSVILSPFIEATGLGPAPDPGLEPHWLAPILDPPPGALLGPLRVTVELRAGDDPTLFDEDPQGGWTTDPAVLVGRFIQLRLTVVVEPEAVLAPTFETIVLPFER